MNDQPAESTANDLANRLRGWIETQGYPLEMRVAQSLREQQIGWDHGRVYRDAITGKLREVDMIGYFDQRKPGGSGTDYNVHAVFECKHSKGDKPWVAFVSGGSTLLKSGQLLSIPATPMMREALKVHSQRIVRAELASLPLGHDSAFRLVKAWVPDQDAAYHAVAGISAAAEALAEDVGRSNHSVLFLPVVVVDSPLFVCRHDPEDGVLLDQTDRIVVMHTYRPTLHIPVLIVHIGALNRFVAQLKEDSKLLAALLRRTPIGS